MDGQEAFRRLANQIRKVGGASPSGGPPKGVFAGGGLLIALVAGGFALNASLFNGAHPFGLWRSSADSLVVDGGYRAIKYSR